MKTLHFQSTIVDSEKINPLFTRVKIHVAYEGGNRNNSFISHETFEKASTSAKFCPIVGEWSESIDDFLGHGGKIEIKDDSIEFIRTTIPYGCISNEDPVWETVEDDDGNVREYFTLTGYVWSSRFPELESLLDNQKNHSMEVDILNGKFQNIDGQKLYVIEDMVFSGFCILGDSTEPCFENSTISAYSLDKDKFKTEFKQMIVELNYSLELSQSKKETELQKGGNEMTEESKKNIADFSLSHEQLENELRRELSKAITEDQWGYSYQDYYLVDFIPEQNLVIAKDWDANYLVGFNFAVDGDNVSVDLSSEKRFKIEYVPMAVDESLDGFSLVTKEQMEYKLQVKEKETESKITVEFEEKVSEKETQLVDLQAQFEVIKQEKEELETFKLDKLKNEKEIQINEVFESVSSKLTEEEIAPFKEKAFEMDVEDLKKELFALVGKKAFEAEANFSAKKDKTLSMALDIDDPQKSETANSYDSIITKYKN